MGMLLGLIFYVLVMSSLLLRSEGSVHSTPDTALKFSQCLIEKISESPFFTFEDRDSLIEGADTMAKTMRYEMHGYSMPLSTKVLTIAFVTSMADVVILEDSSRNIARKEVYSEALEQCSITSTGYIDAQFIEEALSIMTSLENSKAASFDGASEYSDSSYYSEGHFEPGLHTSEEYYEPDLPTSEEYYEPDLPTSEEYYEPDLQTSEEYYEPDLPTSEEYYEPDLPTSEESFQPDLHKREENSEPSFHASDKIFNPPEVQPSPVVPLINPAPVNFNPVFGLPQNSFQFSEVPSVWQSNENIQLTNQPKSDINTPSRFDSSGLHQSGGNLGVVSSIVQENTSPVFGTNSQLTSSEFGGLRIPNMKESKVVAIPPLDIPQFGRIPFQDQSVPKTSESNFQPPDLLNISPNNRKSLPFTSLEPLPEMNVQGSNAFNTPLENIIYNILSNSSTFRNAFHFGIDQQHALNLARTITEQSLSFREDVASEAVKAVSDAISTMPFRSPNGYARAIANSLAPVLQHNGMSLFMHGLRTAGDLLSNLPDTKQLSQPMVFTNDGKNLSDFSALRQREQKQPPFDFQISTTASEDINGEIFANTLSHYLRESPEISNIFCTAAFSVDRIQIIFSIIKASLSEYGKEISSVAASVISGALSELSQDEICSEYPQEISQAISEILDENKFLNNANPEEIFKRIKFSLKQKQTLAAPSEQAQSIYNNASNSSSKDFGNSSAQITPTLYPSFSSISNKHEGEPKEILLSFNETSTDYDSLTTSELYSTSVPDLSEIMKKQEKYIEETREKTFTVSPISSINMPVTESEEGSALDILTTAVFTDVTDEEFTSTSSLIDLITSISESTDDTLNTPDSATEDYGYLIDILLDELESALKSQSSDNTESSTESVSDLSPCENDKFLEKKLSKSDQSSDKTTMTTPNENNPRNEDIFQTEYSQRNRRKMNRKTTIFQVDSTTHPPNTGFNDKRGQDDDVSPPHAPTRMASSRRQPGSKSRILTKDLPSDDTSRDFSLKVLSVETGDSTVLQNNPLRRRNSRRRPGSSGFEVEDSSFGDPSLTRRVMSIRAEDGGKVSSDKPLRRVSHRQSGSTYQIQEKDALPEESFSSGSSIKRPPVHLQPSFHNPVPSDSYPSERMNAKQNSSLSSNLNDPKNSSLLFTRSISRIATSSIEYIRSDSFKFYELCGRLNDLAGIVNIPPLNYCSEIPLIDFLLHVLRSVTNTVKRV